VDRGATLELRVDGKRSVKQLQPLLHADEAKPSRLLYRFAVKACAGVANPKMNLPRSCPQLHLAPLRTAVLCRIV